MKILLYEAMGMTEQEKINIINQAIDEKKPVSFIYKGLDMVEKPLKPDGSRKKVNWRFAYITTLGRSKKGNLIIRAYQVGGLSNSETNLDWKTFLIDELDSISIISEPIGRTLNQGGIYFKDVPNVKYDGDMSMISIIKQVKQTNIDNQEVSNQPTTQTDNTSTTKTDNVNWGGILNNLKNKKDIPQFNFKNKQQNSPQNVLNTNNLQQNTQDNNEEEPEEEPALNESSGFKKWFLNLIK
jgi:hypothetical protein